MCDFSLKQKKLTRPRKHLIPLLPLWLHGKVCQKTNIGRGIIFAAAAANNVLALGVALFKDDQDVQPAFAFLWLAKEISPSGHILK